MRAPSFAEVAQLRADIVKAYPCGGGSAREDEIGMSGQPLWWKRKISRLFADALRKRGWLHEEGYATAQERAA